MRYSRFYIYIGGGYFTPSSFNIAIIANTITTAIKNAIIILPPLTPYIALAKTDNKRRVYTPDNADYRAYTFSLSFLTIGGSYQRNNRIVFGHLYNCI
jgi:hypothetical protein